MPPASLFVLIVPFLFSLVVIIEEQLFNLIVFEYSFVIEIANTILLSVPLMQQIMNGTTDRFIINTAVQRPNTHMRE
ncbi:MAG: hypothetical protein AWU59_632 [Methanolobus sp. T82-4]|nr:MAG: hypothetical protein AWU59_632 [Methanolobus sp. T82-4]